MIVPESVVVPLGVGAVNVNVAVMALVDGPQAPELTVTSINRL